MTTKQRIDIPSDSRILVALSGGVDSGVCALLLKEAGFNVEAIHMTNWEDDDGYCTVAEDIQHANLLCKQLNIPLHQVNFSQQYKEKVFNDFLKQLNEGLTPNPDIACNKHIKFGCLREYANKLESTLLVTGHYAKIINAGNRIELHQSIDPNKDQTYFLYDLSEKQLRHCYFPLGELKKDEVRKIANKHNLPMANKKDSTGICFIGERPFEDFLLKYINRNNGYINDLKGNTIGEHIGLPFYTIGQRHGLNIGGIKGLEEKPWYIAKKDHETNTLIAVQGCDHPILFKNKLLFKKSNWINTLEGFSQSKYTARIRHRQSPQCCEVRQMDEDLFEAAFKSPQRAITSGQHIVLYDGSRCLGGGIIQ